MNDVSHYFDLSSFEHKALFEGCVYPWDVLKHIKDYLNSFSLGKIEVDVPDGVTLINPELISIGPETVLEPGSYIKGPCIIGKGCSVRHGAYIRGDAIFGDGCVIGHASEVKHSIFLNEAKAAHFAYVGDSVLGNRVNLGAGTKCANLKLDSSIVRLRLDGEIYNTDLKKFGAILGDDVQIGCNSVTNPGTMMGKKALCYPCLNVGGVIAAGSVVK